MIESIPSSRDLREANMWFKGQVAKRKAKGAVIEAAKKWGCAKSDDEIDRACKELHDAVDALLALE